MLYRLSYKGSPLQHCWLLFKHTEVLPYLSGLCAQSGTCDPGTEWEALPQTKTVREFQQQVSQEGHWCDWAAPGTADFREAPCSKVCRTTACPQLTAKASGEPCETEKPKTRFFAVPMEMRGSFLVLLLRECFWDLGWLATSPSIGREVGLLVPSTVPQTPFFWAMHIICTGTCGPCSAPWPRQRSSRPACTTWPCRTGPSVWSGTTWAITDQPGTGAGCWATWTPGQWSRSWILASQPPSRCSPCTARTVMTSASHTSWGLRWFSDVATVSTFPLPSRFCLPCPFTLEVLGVKKASVVPRTDWIPLCLSWAHFSIRHVSSLWTSEPNREGSVRLKVWCGQCILSCLLSLLCTPRAWSKLPWQILQNAEAHCLIFLAFHCRIR